MLSLSDQELDVVMKLGSAARPGACAIRFCARSRPSSRAIPAKRSAPGRSTASAANFGGNF